MKTPVEQPLEYRPRNRVDTLRERIARHVCLRAPNRSKNLIRKLTPVQYGELP